ncbi:MAG TPA: hypothetical protein VH008_30700 [Pseudonocardia sp.]|jgi:hypothetical protein|nr:hypothetical protein [Pseudonocardia sp.]
MVGDTVDRLVEEYLDEPEASWSMGTRGAIAEFARDAGEAVIRAAGSVATDRGGIRLAAPPGVRPVAYETPAGPRDDWNHAVALCLPADAARCATRTSVTELGPDHAALRPDDRSAALFDLGLGTPTVDVCVRTADPALLGLLRAAAGSALFADGGTLAGRIATASPHRVFGTACGRVEVYAAIPPADGRSPDGPHTHLLPHLLRTSPGRPAHPPTVPIPPGLVSCAELYPPHPLQDLVGRPIPFDAARHQAFQRLLDRFGDAGQRRLKADTVRAVRSGLAPGPGRGGATDPAGRAAVAVALRQLAHQAAPDTVWAEYRHPPAELLDPDGDRNGA